MVEKTKEVMAHQNRDTNSHLELFISQPLFHFTQVKYTFLKGVYFKTHPETTSLMSFHT